MKTYGNKVEVQQGEEWNLDLLISQSSVEYIPFIVSSQRNNPMCTITIASTKYEKKNRYVSTWWQDLVNGQEQIPRFYQTVPQDIGEVAVGNVPAKPDDDAPFEALYRYTKEEDDVDEKLGHKPYYYVYYDDEFNPNYDYEFRIRLQIKSSETSKWGSQNYLYQITLVDTVSMVDTINEAHESYPDMDWRDWPTKAELGFETDEEWFEYRDNWIAQNVEELYTFIDNRIPGWFQPDIDVDSPVGRIDVPQIILPPTELRVNNNLRTII